MFSKHFYVYIFGKSHSRWSFQVQNIQDHATKFHIAYYEIIWVKWFLKIGQFCHYKASDFP